MSLCNTWNRRTWLVKVTYQIINRLILIVIGTCIHIDTHAHTHTITPTHTHSHPLSEKELCTLLLQLCLNEPETWTHVSYFESRMDLNQLEKTKQNRSFQFSQRKNDFSRLQQ